MAPPPRPQPLVDTDSAAWWKGLEEGRIVLQRCDGCGRVRFPPMPGCPFCGNRGWTVVDASPRGTIYSFVVVHHPFDPAFAEEVPYAVAMVDVEDGARIPARIEAEGELEIGLEVRAAFHRHQGWTELRFAPAGTPGRDDDDGPTDA